MQRTIPLQQGILYGPVRSRRLGLSLGLNILPDEIKVCSLNCRYCQYGWTGLLSIHPDMFAGYLPSRRDVREVLEAKLRGLAKAGTPPDTITFSGNGEATLHPEFPEMAGDVAALRDALAPSSRTAILSNATTVHREEIRRALSLLDDPVLKLDAGLEETFRKLNGPVKGVEFHRMLEGLGALGKRAILQSMFVTGGVDNSGDDEVSAWVGRLRAIGPRFVQIYTLDRGPADGGLLPVSADRLRAIAAAAQEAGVEAQVFE
jgi:wyosine [tRNA(Phe)-imidazoG37] synthetase (radical SAM superfamily)